MVPARSNPMRRSWASRDSTWTTSASANMIQAPCGVLLDLSAPLAFDVQQPQQVFSGQQRQRRRSETLVLGSLQEAEVTQGGKDAASKFSSRTLRPARDLGLSGRFRLQ